MNRIFVMREIYNSYDNGEEFEPPPESDPFLEDPELQCLIGCVQVYLQPLAFMVEIREQLELIDFSRSEVGLINLELIPCTAQGKEFDENDDAFLDSPSEMIGKELHFVVKINNCRGLPARYTVCSETPLNMPTNPITFVRTSFANTPSSVTRHQVKLNLYPTLRTLTSIIERSSASVQQLKNW